MPSRANSTTVKPTPTVKPTGTAAAKRFELPALDFNFASLTDGTDIPPPLPSPVQESVPTPPETPKAEDGKANGKVDNVSPNSNTSSMTPGGTKRRAEDNPASPTLSSRQGSIRRLFSRNMLNNAYANGEESVVEGGQVRPPSQSTQASIAPKKAKRSSGWFSRLRSNDNSAKLAKTPLSPTTPKEAKKPMGPPPPMIPELSELKSKLDTEDEATGTSAGPARTLLSTSRSTTLRKLLPLTTIRHKSGPYGYTQSKALVYSKFGDPSDVLYLYQHSISPSLPKGAVLLRTLAAPVNPSDVNTIQGTYGVLPKFSPLLGTSEPAAIPGNEGCFEVVSVGSGLGKLWGLRSINIVRERDTPDKTNALKKELTDLGATAVITENEFLDRSFGARLRDEILSGDKNQSVRLALNCVGGKSAGAVVRSLGPRGVMVTYGGMSRERFSFPTGPQIFKRLRFEGFWLSEWSKENPAEKRRTIDEIIELMRDGKFKEAPVQEVQWNWETEEKVLKEAVQGTLEGFRSGKGVFTFKDT
ncbi:hypothetical protein B0H66DRAFT_467986 [Apodospora peruviana]|uniref:Alcohol dehydrogenase-like C-terminal domain-containing protein n=1 Tax=Apodospora peruviana TaxID=516989 RepID=A0AAE0IUP7_9PEZI|nr:hypothetical protein B0H66DRAFT_467986 [Apodospora peruviana]